MWYAFVCEATNRRAMQGNEQKSNEDGQMQCSVDWSLEETKLQVDYMIMLELQVQESLLQNFVGEIKLDVTGARKPSIEREINHFNMVISAYKGIIKPQ